MAGHETERVVTDDTEVSTTELAIVLGLTVRRVQQLAQDGTIPTIKRGRFLLCDAVQRYINTLSGREKTSSSQDQEKLDAEVSIKKAKAIIAVLEAKELQGRMHRSEDVAALTEDLIYTMRGMLMALPGRLAVDVAVSTPAEAADIIRREVHLIMDELSRYQYDPKKYEERVRERRRWEAVGRRDNDDE